MNQRLSNKGLWIVFAILVAMTILVFNYKPPCIPAYDTPSYTDSNGIIIVNTTACQPKIPSINDEIMIWVSISAILLFISALGVLLWIFRRIKLNKFYSRYQNKI